MDVLSEGVDLPAADTCLFVEPRQGIRLLQCVGRVLRQHVDKVDALVIGPPIIGHHAGEVVETPQLTRLVAELCRHDVQFASDVKLASESAGCQCSRLYALSPRKATTDVDAAQLLYTKVVPSALAWNRAVMSTQEACFQQLVDYEQDHGHVLVPKKFTTADGGKLGVWVQAQRRKKAKNQLPEDLVARLEDLGFVSGVRNYTWECRFNELLKYREEHGHVLVHQNYTTADGGKLGEWVQAQRRKKAKNQLPEDLVARLEDLGFVWDVLNYTWECRFNELLKYREEHGHVLVPKNYTTADGGKLGGWVQAQRRKKAKNQLPEDLVARLEDLGFVW